MQRACVAMALLSVISGVGACADDDVALQRYCRLVVELEQDDAGLSDATSEREALDAFGEYVERHDEDLDALVENAPADIDEDVIFQVDQLRRAAEDRDVESLTDERLTESTDRTDRFEEDNCPAAVAD